MNRETLGFHERLQLPVPLLDGFFRIVVPIDAAHGRGDVQSLVLRIDEDITAGRTQRAEQANRFVEDRRYCACPRSRSVANRRRTLRELSSMIECALDGVGNGIRREFADADFVRD